MGPIMLTADKRCGAPECVNKGIYRMVGKCINCMSEPILILFTAGHETEKGKCPVCENARSVMPLRIATVDEIPSAE